MFLYKVRETWTHGKYGWGLWGEIKYEWASRGNQGLAGCGGVVRDEDGRWVAGFSRRIGVTTSFVAEPWGLREGLILCSNLNIQSLIVELDAKAVVDVFLNPNYQNNAISPILDNC